METTNEENKIKKQKKTIIILSVFLGIIIVALMGFIIADQVRKQSIRVSLTDYYTTNGATMCYKVEIFSYQNKIINVNDFTFKHDGDNICVSRIEVNDTTYSTSESFVLYADTPTELKLYFILSNDTPNTIYFKFEAVPLGQTKTIR